MIHLVVDSISDISPEEAASLGVELLILPVRFDEEEFHEGVDLTRAEFYRRLRACTDSLPKTSQITPDEYKKTFKRLLQTPGDEVVCITGSSKISGCCQSAKVARSMLDEPERVYVVDSLIAISGYALLVRMAAAQRPRCTSGQELADYVKHLRDHQRTYGQADDLRYLVLGGRLNPAVAKAGTALHIKPMLVFEEGEVRQAGLVRGKDRALNWYADKLRQYPPRLDIPLWVAGADCPETVQKTVDYLQSLGLALPPIYTMDVGPVVGTYVGPGLISVSWIETET